MTDRLCFVIAVLAIALSASTPEDYKLEDHMAVHHTFTGDKTIDVDLVNGSVTVIGDGGSTIHVDGERVIRAANQDQMDRAKKENVLDINEKDGVAQLYENGPFRSSERASDFHGFHDTERREYQVVWNVTAHVPRETALRLRSVNGSVAAQDISGSTEARSVNGALVATFRENPKADSSFTTVNGKIDLIFQPGLSADFELKTVNGGMYTDFASTPLASAGTAAKENGKFVFKSRGESRIRIGSGGPEIRVETVNGSIQIQKSK